MIAASELEFNIYKNEKTANKIGSKHFNADMPKTKHLQTIFDTHRYSSIQIADKVEPLMKKVRQALRTLGVRVEASQIEYNYDQHEITVHYEDILKMADNHILMK